MAKSEKSKRKPLEYLGWGLWSICFVVLYGPFFYLSWTVTVESMRLGVLPWLMAFIMAAFLAGLITTVANTILQRRLEAARKEESRAEKKKKNKK
ncbi:MAG: hypothetical protein COA73_04765 [Candidatus Hydrogenedentota bacterium]|nr:MAG: hypothetical protein COA73_04765 [Candidatus Hydrogenedentota bacterium]